MKRSHQIAKVVEDAPDGTEIVEIAQQLGISESDKQSIRHITGFIRLAGYNVQKKSIWIAATEDKPAHPKHVSLLKK